MAQILTATDIFILPPPAPCVPMAPLIGPLTADGGHVLTAFGNKAIWEADIKDSIETPFPAVPYISPPFIIPGTGHVEFVGWGTFAGVTTDGGEAVGIQSGPGDWKFVVDVKAMMPAPPSAPVPDGVKEYPGTFSIITVQPVCKSA